jgi:hypothetical protein
MAKQNEANTESQNNAPAAADTKKTRRTIILAAVVLIIVGVTAGIAIYQDRVAPFRTVIIEVNDVEIDMRYFLQRLDLMGGESMALLSTLTQEEIIKQVAPESPYNIVLTDDDIDQFARDIARGGADSIEEAEFKEWYRQALNESGLSDTQYRALMSTSLLQIRMQDYLSERLPTVADQVFINLIPVGEDYQIGQEVKAKFDAGEDFASLAEEYSLDPQLQASGGKFGWFPPGALDATMGNVAFDLAVGECSDPFYADDKVVVLIMVSEKAEAREINDQSLALLKSRVLDEWFKSETGNHDVKFHGFAGGGYDSETDAWVQWQLWRMQRDQVQEEDTTQAQGSSPL